MVNSEDFTKRLEKIMDFYGLSATAFSEAIAFNRSTISHLLSGRNKPSLEFVMKVIHTFPEVELYWLLNGKGAFPTQEKKTESQRVSNPSASKHQVKTDQTPSNSFSEGETASSNFKEIDRIVIFYSDGSFKAYEQ